MFVFEGWPASPRPSDEASPTPPVRVQLPKPDPKVVADQLAAALRPFADADGAEIVVPAPRAAATSAADVCSYFPPSEWSLFPPRTAGPVQIATLPLVGGHRGVVASRDVEVGEVLLAEAPLVRWPSSDRAPASLLSAALTCSDAAERLGALALLHPRSMDEALASAGSRERLTRWCAKYAAAGEELAPLWCTAAGGGADGAAAAVLRLCLVVQWNAFDSGLYVHQALFNHACSGQANCDKASHRTSDGVCSVIRATRRIRAGDECLISYLQPPELSHATIASRLEQFDFTCSCARHPVLDAAVARGGGGDAALRALEDVASASLKAALQLAAPRAAVAAARAAVASLVEVRSRQASGQIEGESCAPLAVDARVATPVCAEQDCGERHLAVATLRREALVGLRRRLSGQDKDAADAMVLLLECALELWYTQRLLLGPLHPECAQTLFDIGVTIQRLLATAPQLFFRLFPHWGSPLLAAKAEQRALQLHARIVALYTALSV